jgi:hypothetical protein
MVVRGRLAEENGRCTTRSLPTCCSAEYRQQPRANSGRAGAGRRNGTAAEGSAALAGKVPRAFAQAINWILQSLHIRISHHGTQDGDFLLG